MTAPPREEITGIVRRIGPIFKDGNGIVRLEDGTTCAGPVSDDPPNGDTLFCTGDEVRFHGNWSNHKTHGRQFKFSSALPKTPNTRTGVISYLMKVVAGKFYNPTGFAPVINIDGLGEGTISAIVDKHGPARVVDLLAADPQGCFQSLPPYAIRRADMEAKILELSRRIKADSKYREVRVRLCDLFAGRAFPSSTVAAAIAKWGTLAADRVKRDPFALLVHKMPGAGYSRVERLYLDLGHSPYKIRRQGLAAWHSIVSDRTGSTWIPESQITAYLEEKITGIVKVQKALKFCEKINWMCSRVVDGVKLWTTVDRAEEEVAIQDGAWLSRAVHCTPSGESASQLMIAALLYAPALAGRITRSYTARDFHRMEWPNPDIIEGISEHQRSEIAKAFAPNLGFAMLTGGPGCLHGETPVFDPEDGSSLSVRERHRIGRPFRVVSRTSRGETVTSLALSPMKFKAVPLFRVEFASGRTMTVTSGHRFWTGDSYVSLHGICERLRKSDAFHLPSISDSDLLARLQDARNLSRTVADFQEHCLPYCRPCGGQHPLVVAACQGIPPLQGGARGHSHCYSQSGGLASTLKCNHPCRSSDRPSKPSCLSQIELRFADGCERHSPEEQFGRDSLYTERLSGLFPQTSRWRKAQESFSSGRQSFLRRESFSACGDRSSLGDSEAFSEPSQLMHRTYWPVAADSGRLGSRQKDRSQRHQIGVGASRENINWDEIVNVVPVNPEPYYDFHVPGYENYWAGGFFHHNTGKTHLTAAIVKAYDMQKAALDLGSGRDLDPEAGEYRPIIACAPTGKAAVRATEAFYDRGIPLMAETIHSTLGVQRNGHDGEGWGFRYNQRNRLPPGLIVVDETSMQDTPLMASFWKGMSPYSKILFVGDPDQLPPVGHGAPLRDMIAAGCPHGHLTEIWRFAGRIADACDKIRRGVPWQPSPAIDLNAKFPENLKHLERRKEQILPAMNEWIRKIIDGGGKWGFDPSKDIQVLCATNDMRKTANTILQNLLNPNGATAERCPFRVGDKVVCGKNSWLEVVPDDDGPLYTSVSASDGPKAYIANGDTGFVQTVSPRRVDILFGDRRVTTEPDFWKEIDLAYCLTGHKSQGSQWPVVITLIDDSIVCNRAWYYTCLSRASKLAGLIGPRRSMDMCLKRLSLGDRRTQLTEMLRTCLTKPLTS